MLSAASWANRSAIAVGLFLLGVIGLATGSLASDPLTIAVMYSSDRNRCFTPGVVTSIRHFTKRRAAEINANGGIAGRKVRVAYFDDFATTKETVKNTEAALTDKNLAAIVGMSSSTRGKAIVQKIGAAKVPWISGMSRGDIYAAYPNIFSMEPAVVDEIASVRRFVASRGFRQPAFIGFSGDLYAERIASALNDVDGDETQVAQHWLPQTDDYSLDEDALQSAIDAIKMANSDVVFVALNSGPGAKFLRRLTEAGISIPAFVVLGRISRMKPLLPGDTFKQDMFELGREGVPDVYNERLQQRIWKDAHTRWIFEDARSPDAPAACASKAEPVSISDVRSRNNRRAIGRGVQHGDALMLMAEAAKGLEPGANITDIRSAIAKGLASHRQGKKIFRGWWQDWSFAPSRAVGEQTLLVRQRSDETDITLAPKQYVLRGGKVLDTPVVYIAVDPVRIYRVDSNEKTFQAEFYLSFRTEGDISLSDIEFTNAFRSPLSNEPVISARRIHGTDQAGPGLKLYRITGKFTFDPELNQYPFDRQRFSVSFQPSNTTSPFFIQPPPPRLRKADFDTDGWRKITSYVGSDQDIISVVGNGAGDKVIIPLDKFNYTWIMKRLATDYYLQVIVPLIVILAVTYLSIFIPAQRLESVVAIQVTALLSSIALYLAIPKVDSDQATTSDIVFVVTYTAISVMLGLSILRVNFATLEWSKAAAAVKGVQLTFMPIVVLLMSDYILAQNAATGVSPIRKYIGDIVSHITTRAL